MQADGIIKTVVAKRMATSRALLDPNNISLTLHILQKAAAVARSRLRLELLCADSGVGEQAVISLVTVNITDA
jgi:hypothetical protein